MGEVVGTRALEMLPISSLDLDWNNPRIPSAERSPEMSQLELLELLNKRYDPLSVARSIVANGYFMNEPLVAVRKNERYRVLEGNRRLTALKALTDSSLRRHLAKENSGWSRLTINSTPEVVPVLVVEREEQVDALLGLRHISGVAEWSPYQQAEYIAKLVDERGMSLGEVADLVNRPTTEVRSMYRNLDIIRQARGSGIPVKGAESNFGVFTLAMGRSVLRDYVGACPPRDVDPDYLPIPDDRVQSLKELLSFLFGDANNNRVIEDSRQVTKLAKVISDPSGVALGVLRKTRNLEEALEALADANEAALKRLRTARLALQSAVELRPECLPPEHVGVLDEVQSILARLLQMPRCDD